MKTLIWEKRNEKGYSLRELEKLSGISHSEISRLENNIMPLSWQKLDKLAKVLDCSVKDLIDD
ncbi:MAG: helix-turn-helix domain-containing protein [Eubacterium sp.]